MQLYEKRRLLTNSISFALTLGYSLNVIAAEQITDTNLSNQYDGDVLTVTATEKNKTSWLSPSYQQEKTKLAKVAGGSNLVVIEKENRLATLQDALDYQPGVIVQNFFGGIDQPRLNIRGSGVQSAPLARGVLLLQDGLPVTDADGSFHISTLDMRDALMVSVRRGANSLSPQSNSLGGELDLISYSGRDENGRIRYEYGSFGRQGMQAALGGVSDDQRFDARLNMSYDHFDGYRKHSSSQRKTVRANVGYLDENFENRTWIGWTDLRFDVAGPVSESVLESNPTDVYPMVWLRDPHRNVEQMRAANKSSWRDDNQEVALGLWYIQTHDNFTTPAYYRFSNSYTKGAQFSYELETDPVTYRSALAWDHMILKSELMQNRKGMPSDKTLIGHYDGRAENIYGTLGVGLHITDSLLMNLDLKGTYAKRDVQNRAGDKSLDQSWTFWTPKAGLVWTPVNNQRLFANISASKEPATFWEIINSSDGQLTELKPQTGVTFEIGGAGELYSNMNWDLAIYRSFIKDEYITTYDTEGNVVGVFNYAAKTRHQGFELGLNGNIPVNSGEIDYRIAWTYNDFRFMGGEYNGNYIAGIPRNIVSSEILYKIGRWSFGPNLHWAPTDMAVDHENHLEIQKRKHYAILGLKGSYKHDDRWSAYLALDNLTSEKYATTSVANRTVTKNDSTLFPGMGFSVNGGLTYSF